MRFNSVLGAFFFVVVASIVALITFVQTKSFGRLATRVITDVAQKKAQTQVGVRSIKFSVFPPGLELNKVSVKKDISADESFEAEFGKLGFYISLIEIEEKKLTFGEIRISDSVIEYKFPPKEDEEPLKELPQEVINKVFDIADSSPVRVDTLLIENSKIILNHELLEAKRLKLFKKSDNFMLRFHVANLKPLEESELSIDEIWGDIEIGRKNARIFRLKVQHDVQSVLLKGRIKNYPKLLSADADLSGEAQFHLKGLSHEVPMPEEIQLESGTAHLSFNVGMNKKKVKGNGQLSLTDLRSNIVYADSLVADLDFTGDELNVKKLSFSYLKEKLELAKPVAVYNFKTNKVLPDVVEADVENVTLNNALRILGPSLEPLKGELTGRVGFQYKQGDLYFIPRDNFTVRDLGLIVGKEKPFTVLMIKKVLLSKAAFKVVNKEFVMESNLEAAHSKLHVIGKVNSKQVEFNAIQAKIDFEDLGNIANLDIKGRGFQDITVKGPLEDVVITVKGISDNFEVLGYKLGKTDKIVSIALEDSQVVIEKLESQFSNTKISGSGAVNYDTLDIALDIKSQLAYYTDLELILKPILAKLDFLPSDLDFNSRIDASIYGKTSLKELKIKSNVNFKDLHAYGENFSSGEFNVGMNEQMITINDLEIKKGEGQINGNFSYSMITEKMKLDYTWDNLLLDSFNLIKKIDLNLTGDLSGTFNGSGTSKDYLFHLQGKMQDTKSSTSRFEDSSFDLDIKPQQIAGTFNLLGKIITSEFDYSLNRKNNSEIKFALNAPEIKPFLVAVGGQHLDYENIAGSLKLDLHTSFKDGFENLFLEANLGELIFKNESFSVDYKSNTPQFKIENSKIKKWDLNIQQTDLFLTSKGEGTFGSHVSMIHDLHFSSKLFEVLFAPVLSADGVLRNSFKIDGRGKNYYLTLTSKTSDLDLTIEDVPFPLNNLSYNLDYSQKKLYIHDLNSTLENGSISLKGDVYFDDDEPDVNIRYSLDKAEIPILGKSNINISGEGIILGNNRPYNLGGDIIVNKGQIINEITDFSSKSTSIGQVRFLPKTQESALEKLVNLNLNVKADNPVRIANSLMDVALKGEVNLSGSPLRPRGEGHLSAPANSSRIFFKNSEYFITSADLNFSSKKEITNPDFDVQAMTTISNYKVYPKAYGDLEKFNFDLTSEPPLSRNSIFSLIAFGYTDEIQNALDPKEQQKLSQVGVGSFVFDRFKISDILNKQFGLQVNLGTVFEQSQNSMLSGRSQEGQGTIGRVRSATKLELKKRLNEATTLSVSSTMGGEIGQRQSMNLNYGVSKKVQLEGVYEVRTNADGQEDVIDNSIGGDLKFRWTFK